MKKSVLFLPLLLTMNLFSQNLDEMRPTQVEYNRAPMNQSLNDVKSVFVQVDGYNSNSVGGIIEAEINKNVYKLVGDRASADLIVGVSVEKFTVSPPQMSSETVQKTSKDGKSYSETNYYFVGLLKYNVTVKFQRKSGEIVKSQILGQDLNITKDRTVANSKSDAENNFYKVINTSEIEILNSLSSRAFKMLESDYLTSLETLVHVPIKIKSRKFDYADLNEAAELLNNWISVKTFDGKDESIVKAIKIYEEALKELNTEVRKVRVNKEVGAVCNFELAFINFALKNFSKANELILKSEELDKRVNYSQEALKDVCADLQKRKVF